MVDVEHRGLGALEEHRLALGTPQATPALVGLPALEQRESSGHRDLEVV